MSLMKFPMNMNSYPWYELIENSNEITQGDILLNCPVAVLLGCEIDEERINSEIHYIDGIIMTQACDIANSKVENIILCAVTSVTNYSKGKTNNQVRKSLDSIKKGQQNALHIINRYHDGDLQQDYYIVNFKDIFSIPIDLARKVAETEYNCKRLRLLPPYREHLSQAFARYFMRVGLPIDINLDEK